MSIPAPPRLAALALACALAAPALARSQPPPAPPATPVRPAPVPDTAREEASGSAPEGRPAASDPSVPRHDMSGGHGMNHHARAGQHTGDGGRMDRRAAEPAARHGVAHDGMAMPAPQDRDTPPGTRSPDYSEGVGYGDMPGMGHTPPRFGSLLLDKLEAAHGREGTGQAWDLQAGYGGDLDKLWLRSEGERSGGRVDDGSAEALWNHLFAPYWSTLLGVRQDFGIGPGRTWAALGVEGLAPYFFDVEATAYVGEQGRTAARLRASYEMPFTQRLILQPEFEVDAYGKADPARGLGRGVAQAVLGLRLRYEVRREVAPYIGVQWIRRFAGTARRARDEGQAVFDAQVVAGVRLWF